MKTRLVLWGTDDNQERVLLALSLNAGENTVDIWTFPAQVATETLYTRLMNEWRMGKDIPFPNVFVQIQQPLTLSEKLLPDNVTPERQDLLHRAQTEWQFVVLSAKLYDNYRSELEYIRDKVENLDRFNSAIWEELKGYWGKVQSQIYDKNLYRDHAQDLRDSTNALFAKLKELRKSHDEEFKKVSRENAQVLIEKLAAIEERIEQGSGLKQLFEELKVLQREYKGTDLARDDRSRIWNRLDKAFKVIKEKRFGPGHGGDKSPLTRLQRRYDGLIAAIGKMERSIARDRKEQNFQDRRISESAGQLESQIRQAKLVMINERIESKEAKLSEMHRTREELEKRIEKAKQKELQLKEQESKAKGHRVSEQETAGEGSSEEKRVAPGETLPDEMTDKGSTREKDSESSDGTNENPTGEETPLVRSDTEETAGQTGQQSDHPADITDVVVDKIREAIDDPSSEGEEE